MIDIGTNSTRLLVADVTGTSVHEVERHSEVTRLGRGVDYTQLLSDDAIELVCETVARYIERITELGAESTLVIATSAVRDASNGSAFVAELRERFALDCRVLGGDEEAHLTYTGAISSRSGDESLLVVDIGGRSTEIVIGRGSETTFHPSLQAGVVRHTERQLPSDPPAASELENLANDIEGLISDCLDGLESERVDRAIGVAGTPSALAAIDLELDPYDSEAVEGHVLEFGKVQNTLSRLSSMSLEERKKIVGLHPARARAIIAGVVILIEVMRAFGLSSIEVSEHDILYGGVITVAADLA